MSVFRTFIIICFLSFEEVFSLSINTVAGNIVATAIIFQRQTNR